MASGEKQRHPMHQRSEAEAEAKVDKREALQHMSQRATLADARRDARLAEQLEASRTQEELGLDLPPGSPLGTTPVWIRDFSVMGTAAGLALALFCVQWAPSMVTVDLVSFLVGLPIVLGVLAAASGATAGFVLNALRQKTAAWAGLLLATICANAVPSMLTLSAPEALAPWTSPFLGNADPLALAVTVLIPIAAVMRAKGRSTLLLMWGVGLIAGALIGTVHI